MIRLASGLVSVSLIVLVATAGGVWWLESWLDRPGPLSESITVILEPGMGVQSIANQLAKIEAVENAQLFVLAVTQYGDMCCKRLHYEDRRGSGGVQDDLHLR